MNDKYEKFVEEAFIDPIRSVLIVDDDYPTIDEIFLNNGEKKVKSPKKWHEYPQAVKKVIDEFRDQKLPYILDIHDANNLTADEELEGVEHLHQTDLLILDFELDRTKRSDGTLSLQIARKVMSNSHYNLVVVHTTDKLDSIFPKFLMGLLSPILKPLSNSDVAMRNKAFDSFDRDHEAVENLDFEKELRKVFGYNQYFEYWKNLRVLSRVASGKPPFTAVKALYEQFKIDKQYWNVLSKHALIEFEAAHKGSMSPEDCEVTSFSTGEPKWIRSDKAFIAFAHKPAGEKLIDTLRQALLNWNPKPSRLFLTKLMAEIDEHGVEVQKHALDDNYSSAIWYHRMLIAKEDELETCVSDTIQRHANEMMRNILPGINKFANRLVEVDKKSTKAGNFEVVQEHYNVDLSDADQLKKSQLQLNALVCSQKPTGWHLQTGHIFELAGDKWVCVSPACDTIPGQVSAKQLKIQGERLRFTAVMLHKKKNKIPIDVQNNRYVFLANENDVDVYSFTVDAVATPDWVTLFAENKGKFDDQGGMSFSVSRIEQDAESKELIAKSYTVKIIAQLRYEYALNLIQKLSGSLSRVGLDFSG